MSPDFIRHLRLSPKPVVKPACSNMYLRQIYDPPRAVKNTDLGATQLKCQCGEVVGVEHWWVEQHGHVLDPVTRMAVNGYARVLYKLMDHAPKPYVHCAQCGEGVYDHHYLCEVCRD